MSDIMCDGHCPEMNHCEMCKRINKLEKVIRKYRAVVSNATIDGYITSEYVGGIVKQLDKEA